MPAVSPVVLPYHHRFQIQRERGPSVLEPLCPDTHRPVAATCVALPMAREATATDARVAFPILSPLCCCCCCCCRCCCPPAGQPATASHSQPEPQGFVVVIADRHACGIATVSSSSSSPEISREHRLIQHCARCAPARCAGGTRSGAVRSCRWWWSVTTRCTSRLGTAAGSGLGAGSDWVRDPGRHRSFLLLPPWPSSPLHTQVMPRNRKHTARVQGNDNQ